MIQTNPKILGCKPKSTNTPGPQLSNTILNPDPQQSLIYGQQPQRKPDPINPNPDPPDLDLLVSSSTNMDIASDRCRLVQL